MVELVMLDMAPGAAFVEALERTWLAGNAVFPLDQRLPTADAARSVAIVRPTAVIGSDGEQRALDNGLPVADGDAVVVTTSGTTGKPKAVVHTHESIAASAIATSAYLNVDPASDRWLACLPPTHIGGLAVIMRALLTGTPLTVQPRFEPSLAEAAAHSGATLVSLVTRALRQIDTSLFRSILLGGAAPPTDRPPNSIATWGMTETGSGCVYDGWPLPEVELRAVDGEIHVRAPMLFRCYRDGASESDPRDIHGWFSTNDLGSIAPDGRLSVSGRRGDVINTGGEKVWPGPVEVLLSAHPGIAEVAVFARPDHEWGQRVVAAVVLSAGRVTPTLDDLRDLVKANLGVWHAPRELVVVEQLPKTALGKVQRHQLK